ncbi:MAG: TetR/AcrR family transcriptional regulator [Oscillospiraceae bacterium]|nr:TetR/AcrR family transcriptional regulator [Oscillospiraceae bacterium]
MANRTPGVTEKLLECAMQEFLANGYNGASMRTIAENAGTTPRAIYTRYEDKEGLFCALVEESANELKDFFEKHMQAYSQRPVEEQKELFHDEDFDLEHKRYMQSIIDLIYDRYNEFKLLICCANGTRYADFTEPIAELDEKYTLKYIEDTGNDVISSGRAGTRLIHLLCSSYVYGFFEIVRHDMTKEQAEVHISQLQDFFSHGWDKLFNP